MAGFWKTGWTWSRHSESLVHGLCDFHSQDTMGQEFRTRIAWGENSASNQFPKNVTMESMECTSRRLCYPGATTEVPDKVGDGWDESQAGQLGDQEGIARVRFLTARRI